MLVYQSLLSLHIILTTGLGNPFRHILFRHESGLFRLTFHLFLKPHKRIYSRIYYADIGTIHNKSHTITGINAKGKK